jgi:hypothetical protein
VDYQSEELNKGVKDCFAWNEKVPDTFSPEIGSLAIASCCRNLSLFQRNEALFRSLPFGFACCEIGPIRCDLGTAAALLAHEALSGRSICRCVKDMNLNRILTIASALTLVVSSVRAPLVPKPRVHVVGPAIGDKIYLVGGELHHAHDGDTRSLQIFDTTTQTWSHGAPAPRRRSHAD